MIWTYCRFELPAYCGNLNYSRAHQEVIAQSSPMGFRLPRELDLLRITFPALFVPSAANFRIAFKVWYQITSLNGSASAWVCGHSTRLFTMSKMICWSLLGVAGWLSTLSGVKEKLFQFPSKIFNPNFFQSFLRNPESSRKTENRFGISVKRRFRKYKVCNFPCTFEETQNYALWISEMFC